MKKDARPTPKGYIVAGVTLDMDEVESLSSILRCVVMFTHQNPLVASEFGLRYGDVAALLNDLDEVTE